MNTRQLVLMAIMLIATGSPHTQGNDSTGIVEAMKVVASYFDPGAKLHYAIGAVIDLVSGTKVYNKSSSNDPGISKVASSWFGAYIFLIIAATTLRPLFL